MDWPGLSACLFALSVVVYEFFNKTPRFYWSLFSVVLALLCGVCSVYFSMLGEYRFAFLPDAYYHTALEPKTVIYYSWISLPLILIVAFLLRKRKKDIGKKLPDCRRNLSGNPFICIMLVGNT